MNPIIVRTGRHQRNFLVYWTLLLVCFNVSPIHCDLASQLQLHTTCWVDFKFGSIDWTVRLNAYKENVVPARILQLKEWSDPLEDFESFI